MKRKLPGRIKHRKSDREQNEFILEVIGMDIGVIVALSGLGLAALLAVLMGIVAGISAVVGIGSPHQDE